MWTSKLYPSVITVSLSAELKEVYEGYAEVQAHWYITLFIYKWKGKGKESKRPFVANTFQHDKYVFLFPLTEWFATWQQTLCVRAWLLIQKVKNIYIYICIYTYMYTYIYIKQKFNYSNICYSVIKSVIYKNEMTGFCLPLRHFKLTPWNWCLYKALPHVIQSHVNVYFQSCYSLLCAGNIPDAEAWAATCWEATRAAEVNPWKGSYCPGMRG